MNSAFSLRQKPVNEGLINLWKQHVNGESEWWPLSPCVYTVGAQFVLGLVSGMNRGRRVAEKVYVLEVYVPFSLTKKCSPMVKSAEKFMETECDRVMLHLSRIVLGQASAWNRVQRDFLGGSEANFLEICFRRIASGNFHTKAASKKSRPPSGNFWRTLPPPELYRRAHNRERDNEESWAIAQSPSGKCFFLGGGEDCILNEGCFKTKENFAENFIAHFALNFALARHRLHLKLSDPFNGDLRQHGSDTPQRAALTCDIHPMCSGCMQPSETHLCDSWKT